MHGKRRTTGMRKGMRESYIEDLASHGGPESCVGDPRGRSEALIGVYTGRAIEPRNGSCSGVPTRSCTTEGNTAGGVIASGRWAPRGQRTRARVRSLHVENREISCSPVCLMADGPLREDRGRTPEMNECEKSDRLILPVSPPNKAGTPVAEAGEGSGLGKENAASKTHSGRRAGSSAPSALDRVRQVAPSARLTLVSKPGARCGSSARRDLCGGRAEPKGEGPSLPRLTHLDGVAVQSTSAKVQRLVRGGRRWPRTSWCRRDAAGWLHLARVPEPVDGRT